MSDPIENPPVPTPIEIKKEIKALEVNPDVLDKVLDIVAKSSREAYILGFDAGLAKAKEKLADKPKDSWW